MTSKRVAGALRAAMQGGPTAALVVVALVCAAQAAALAVGDAAPDFELQGSDGKVYRLNDLLERGDEKGIILAWFPKAFTPG